MRIEHLKVKCLNLNNKLLTNFIGGLNSMKKEKGVNHEKD